MAEFMTEQGCIFGHEKICGNLTPKLSNLVPEKGLKTA